ncbi:MAG: hypothetical protein ABI306_07200 [Caulobacteraceae bacterium]
MRFLIIFSALSLIAVVGRDVYARTRPAPPPAVISAEDQDADSDAFEAAEEGMIYGPAVLGDYYRAGYAWAQAEGIDRVVECPGDVPAYKHGCADFVVGRVR